MNNWSEIVREWEDLLRLGERESVKCAILKQNLKKIPREHLATVAYQAIRAQAPDLANRVLARVFQPTKEAPLEATSKEIIVYGLTLLKLGASKKAISVLGQEFESPEAKLYTAYAHVTLWEYLQAEKFITEYLQTSDEQDYQHWVAQINLLASLVHTEQLGKAENLLDFLEPKLKERQFTQLMGNCRELRAQIFYRSGNYGGCEAYLKIGKTGKDDSEFNLTNLYEQKWLSFSRIARDGWGNQSQAAWQTLRENAVRRQHWETIRECDLFKAKITQDHDLFMSVYFQTPFLSYRQKMQMEFGNQIDIPDQWTLKFGQETSSTLDLVSTSDEDLRQGKLLSNLLRLLVSDGYRPGRLASFFHELYPGEFYSLESTLQRVEQLLKRLNQWARQQGFPIEVGVKNKALRLKVNGDLRIIVPKDLTVQDSDNVDLEKLKRHFANSSEFTAAQVAEALGVSKRKANNIIKANKLSIESVGSGRYIRYKFATG